MATYYARAGGGNWTAAATWSLTSGGGATGSTPTAADECIFDASSGAVTINSGAVCRSWTVNGYTGTITHTAAVTLAIGDATAATGNNALNFATTGWTYTLGNASTSALSFVSTSATQQTITPSTKTVGNVTINGSGSSYILGSAITFSNFTLTVGTFSTGNFNMTGSTVGCGAGTATISLGSSLIILSSTALAWNFYQNGDNKTVNAGTSTIRLTGSSAKIGWRSNSGGNNSTRTYYNIEFTSGGSNEMYAIASPASTGVTVNNLTITGSASKTGSMIGWSGLTVNGTLTVNGNSAINRYLIRGNTVGTAETITAAAVSMSNVDLKDITGAGAASWNLASITGNSGDCGGNSGITFTTPSTQTATGTASFTWSTHGWTSRVPLPQDDVSIPNAFIAGRVITADMPRSGKSITYTCTGNPQLTLSTTTVEFYGSLTMASGMTVSGGNNILVPAGRSSYTITSNGVTFSATGLTLSAPTGTYTLGDALSISNTFNLNLGTFDTGSNYTFSCLVFQSANAGTRTFNGNSSTVNLNATTAVNIINMANTPGLTINATNTTFVIADASANTRTIIGGGMIFGTLTYTVAGSTGELVINGSPWFLTLNFSDASNARTLTFAAGSSNPIFNLNVFGTPGKLMTVRSSSGGSVADITKPFGGALTTTSDYLSVQDIRSQQPLSFFAGANSTNVSGNTNVIFTVPGTFLHSQSAGSTATSTSRTQNWTVPPVAGTALFVRMFFAAAPGTVTNPTGFSAPDITKVQGVGTFYQWSKRADGTETSVSLSWANSVSAAILIESYSGYTGTPTVDVTDSNSAAGTGTSISTTAGTGPTNTTQPALAMASYGVVSGSMGAITNITNDFMYNFTNAGANNKFTVKELTSLAAVDSTLTWTTTRTDRQATLVVYKDVALTSTGNFFTFFN